MRMHEIKKVLVLCIGNSCRSQMAEGLVKYYFSDKYQAYSAGSKPSTVNPNAITVMAELGIDISASQSKHVNKFKNETFDLVLTVCEESALACPVFIGQAGQRMHIPFRDPVHAAGTQEEILQVFREVRDEIYKNFKKVL